MENPIIRYSVSAVILADFPLEQYSLQWFSTSDILGKEEISEAFGKSTQNQSSVHVEWSDMQIDLMPEKLQILGSPNKAVRITEIITSILHVKYPNNLKAMGINGEVVFRLTREQYDNRKEVIFPQNVLTNLFDNNTFVTEIQCHNNSKIPQLHYTLKLLEYNHNSADILFSYNNHFPIEADQLEVALNCAARIGEYWTEMSEKMKSFIING